MYSPSLPLPALRNPLCRTVALCWGQRARADPRFRLQKYGVSFETGSLQYAARGAAMSLSLLKGIHLLESTKDASFSNTLGTVWAAKPKLKAGAGLPVLPEGFVQPTKNSTPFHYSFPTASRRVTCACTLFCVARTFAGVLRSAVLQTLEGGMPARAFSLTPDTHV